MQGPRNHIIPVFLLKNFRGKAGMLASYDIQSGKVVYAEPENMAYSIGHHSLSTESYLQRIESKASNVINKSILKRSRNNEKVVLSHKERTILTEFALLQAIRTFTLRDLLPPMFDQVKNHFGIDQLPPEVHCDPVEYVLNATMDDVPWYLWRDFALAKEKPSPTGIMGRVLANHVSKSRATGKFKLMDLAVQSVLSGKSVRILSLKENQKFILGDNPLAVGNPFVLNRVFTKAHYFTFPENPLEYGRNPELCLPISPMLAIIWCYIDKTTVSIPHSNLANALNNHTAKNCGRYLYGESEGAITEAWSTFQNSRTYGAIV